MAYFELYVLAGCPYCNGALSLLDRKGYKYRKHIVAPSKKDYYKRKNGINTFPQIFLIDGKGTQVVGGYTELQQLIN